MLRGPDEQAAWEDFQAIFYKKCISETSIYMVAPDAMVQQYIATLAAEREIHLVSSTLASTASSRLALSSSMYHRMKEYRRRFKALDVQWPSCLINLGQTAGFFPSLQQSAPALLTHSFLFNLSADLAAERVVHPLEYLAIMGFPIWLGEPGSGMHSQPHFPWPEKFLLSLKRLKPAQIRHMAGNGMHLAAISAMMVWVLCILQ